MSCKVYESDYEEEYSEHRDRQIEEMIEKMEVEFVKIGVKFYKAYKCCGNCAATQLDIDGVKNYVFYTEQTDEDLKNGSKRIYLNHGFDKKTNEKVLQLVNKYKDVLIWNGDEDRSILLTCESKGFIRYY